MRSLAPRLRSFLTHSGQAVVLTALAGLAMAAAPVASIPEAEAPETPVAPPVTAQAAPAGPVMRNIAFTAPLKGYEVNSPFGLRKLAHEARARAHKGVDIAAPHGTAVYVVAEGEVVRTGYQAGGYGNFIEVRHPNGMTSLYAHLSRIDVGSGMAVAPGRRIGLVGSTGYSTGPHLHLEVRRRHAQVDPARVLGRSFPAPVDMPKAP